MAEQVDKLRNNKTKPLYTKKVRYVAIRKLIPRDDPFHVSTMENYFPFRGEGGSTGLKDSLRRVASRRKTIEIKLAATHEVHLARDTVTDSMEVLGDPSLDVAAMFNIYGSTRQLLNNRPSGSGIYMVGEGENEAAYFVLTWKQVLPVPDYKKKGSSKARRERMRYPTENFCRIEDGAKVYYLQKASPEEFKAIIEALKSVKEST